MSKQIYVAAPFTADNEEEFNLNVACARWHGMQVAKMGGYPVMPTSNTAYGFRHLQTTVFWYNATEDLLSKCDAILLCGGMWGAASSKGMWREYEFAQIHNIPIFKDLVSLNVWLNHPNQPANFAPR